MNSKCPINIKNSNLIEPAQQKKKKWQYPIITILILIFLYICDMRLGQMDYQC